MSNITPSHPVLKSQLAGWRETKAKNNAVVARITLLFESVAVVIVFIGMALTVFGLLN